ncbi:5-azacytidine resistance protein azr1 [Ceratocystis platani]|nr:5-azacytidine resistance protein azr1 [Ceratocystis platani]
MKYSTSSSDASPTSLGSPQLSYGVAAAFIGKDLSWHATRNIHHFNPHKRVQPVKKTPEQRPPSGHDAFFISHLGDTGAVAFGVADGVGGWVDSGVDPADFSHGICDYMAMVSFAYPGHDPVSPKAIMQKGYEAVCNDRTVVAGSSTAVVGVAAPNGAVEIANLGDSGFIHLRLGAVHAYSKAQQHSFNTPYQMSVIPPSMAARIATFGGAHLSDMPHQSDITHHNLQSGDVLVLASDGVWDNMFNEDILKVVGKMMLASGAWTIDDDGAVQVAPSISEMVKVPELSAGGPQALNSQATLQSLVASRIALTAKANSHETRRDGPFAKAMKRINRRERWVGGKVDDIMVVVLIATQDGTMVPVKSRL